MSIIFLIIGLALAVFGIVKTILIHNNDEHHSATPFIAAIVIGVVIALSGTCFVQIPTGFTGVKATFGQISEKTLPNGGLYYVVSDHSNNTRFDDIQVVALVHYL